MNSAIRNSLGTCERSSVVHVISGMCWWSWVESRREGSDLTTQGNVSREMGPCLPDKMGFHLQTHWMFPADGLVKLPFLLF